MLAPPAIDRFSTGARTDAWTTRTLALPDGGGDRSSSITFRPRSACLPTPATEYALPSATVTFVVSTGGSVAGAPANRIETAYVPVGSGRDLDTTPDPTPGKRSEEHTSELPSQP